MDVKEELYFFVKIKKKIFFWGVRGGGGQAAGWGCRVGGDGGGGSG